MNIFHIIFKEIKQNFRDKKATSMMVLFPIVLILILGSALKSSFTSTNVFSGIKVLYTNEGNSEISKQFDNFTEELKKMKINFTKTKDVEKGKKDIQDLNYSCYININDKTNEIEFYKNDKYNFESGLVESVLNTFVSKSNAVVEIAKINPASLEQILSKENLEKEYVKTLTLNKKRSPSSIDYYAVTMLTLIIMYSALTGAFSIIGDKINKTWDRVLITPTERYKLFVSKLSGGFLTTVIQVFIVVIVSKLFMGAYWGENIVPVIFILLSEIIMAISLGVGLALIIKNENVVPAIINSVIPLFVFFGGGYFPIDGLGGNVFSAITKISPLNWVNHGIFKCIYDGNYDYVIPAIMINLVISLVFILGASLMISKEGK